MNGSRAKNFGKLADGWRFWIDRGGTFTDAVAARPDGRLETLKLPSVSAAYGDAAIEAMRRLLGVEPDEVFPAERVRHVKVGTTVATNALLERGGAKTLLVVTAGFADALLIGDQSRPDLFALDIVRPAPLYAEVTEADERLDAQGRVVRPLDEAKLLQDLQAARARGLTSCAIAFLHADLNARHEARAYELARQAGFEAVIGSEVSPLPRFIPRAQTAVADAYLSPPVRAYAQRLAQGLGSTPLLFMTSNGGLASAGAFRGRDAVLSGPAGGVVGVARVAEAAGAKAALGFDMGGTSTDVCRYAGALERRETACVAGVAFRAPMLDVETVASGGGSILTFDGLRARVGPKSAGAEPGPAAYGRGGPATVTDANLVLGRMDPRAFPTVFGPTGEAPLDPGAARARLAELAAAMGTADIGAAAQGFIDIAVEQMAGAISKVSTARGFDPRDHALVAFGGAAGQVACAVADALQIDEVLCPRYASVLSAWGIGQAGVTAVRQAGLEKPLDEAGLEAARQLCAGLEVEARRGLGPGETSWRLKVRYAEADTALETPFGALGEVRAAFEAAHQRLFGFLEPGATPIIAAVEVETSENASSPSPPPSSRKRLAEVLTEGEGRDDLEAPVDGPRLIVRRDTQIWVAPGWRAEPDAEGLIRLRRLAPRPAPASGGETADPITLELFNRRFMGIAEAMGAALERTARSVNIKERLDFSCALFDAGGGLVANAPHMPVHLGSMGASVRAVAARHADLAPGDAFALNNPYAGGTHLPDITVVMPVFTSASAPAFFVAARGHHADVGGMAPGSMPAFSRRIEDEGVLLDALPILRGGVFLEDDVRQALAVGPHPARAPERNLGDLKAQLAACRAGAQAVLALIEAHGEAQVARYMAFVQANAEALVRRAVGALQDGRARLPIDGGGHIVVEVRVDHEAGSAVLDFTASADQVETNFNAPASIVDAAALYVFRTLVNDDIPLNAGCLKPLDVRVRPGSMLDPAAPAAVVAGNVETSQHVVDALYEALGVLAGSQGTMNNLTFGDETAQYYETICGGAGASGSAAGASAVHTHMTNSRLTDPEILERRFPVRLETFAVRAGSGGAGAQPGGEGAVRRLRFLAPMQVSLLSSHRRGSPRGLGGGGDGAPGTQRILRADGSVQELDGCFSLYVSAGDAIEIQTPGGGGFGAPPPSRRGDRRS